MTWDSILMIVLLGAAFYFLLIRPQQKRAKDAQSMASSLQPGTRVMTTAGIHGTVRHVGERQVIVEIAPGVEMTVVKQAVAKVLRPEDDEFEYADDDDAPSDEAETEAEMGEPAPEESAPSWEQPADPTTKQ